MEVFRYKNINYSEVLLSELGSEMRFDADYWDPVFLLNEDKLKSKVFTLIKHIAPNPQYGLSVSMNDEENGYKILKMDNIMEMLAEDKDAKYANVSLSTFNHFKLKNYDVLFNRVNSEDFVGRTGIYLLNGEHTFASYLVRLDSGNQFTNCYITAFLNCKHGKTSLQRVKRRAVNQANINAKELGNLIIPSPSVELENEIYKLISKSQALSIQSDMLYAEAETLFLNALGIQRWQPSKVKFNHAGITIEVEDAINSDVHHHDVLTTNRLDAEFWQPKYLEAEKSLKNNGKFKSLFQIAKIKKGTQARSSKTLSSGIHYASIRNCDNLEITTSEFTDAKKTILIQPKEIVFAITGATIGKAAINNSNTEIAISGDLAGIFSTQLPAYYLLIVLSSELVLELAKRYTTGATNGHLAVRDLMNFPIPILDKKIMNAIENKMIHCFLNRRKVKALLEVSKQLVDILIEESDKEAINFSKKRYKEIINYSN